MKTRYKFILATLLCFSSFACFADIVIDKAKSNNDKTIGHIENTQVYFSVINGQSLNPTREMQRITVELNDKVITIQRSKDHKEFYVKGQDKTGGIVILAPNDYAIIQEAVKNLAQKNDSNDENAQTIEVLNSVFNLLSSYPNNMPLLIWTNNKTDIAALTTDTVIDNKRISQVKSVDNVILSNSEKLQFPEIEPYQTNGVVTKSKSQAKILGTGQKFESYNSSTSLCNSISGEKVKGVYPIVAKAPYEKKPIAIPIPTIDYLDMNKQGLISNTWQGELYVKTTKKYDVVVGGKECLGRCGFQCTGILGTSDLNKIGIGYDVAVATNKNNYSVDCLAHDMCSVKGKGGGNFGAFSFECNAIFAHAADDFLDLPDCEHDLEIENYFIAKSPKATEADTNLTSKDTLYVIYDFTNAGNSKLPHSDISILFSLDGKSIGENKISKGTKLEANEKLKGYRKLGKLSQGKHSISLQINAPNIIENPSSANENNLVDNYEFEVQGKTSTGYTKIANNGSTLPDSAQLGTKPKDWACTKDNKTGLIWEVKTSDGGLRDEDNYYTNYDAIYPGNPSKLGAATNTDGYVKAVNAQGLCGSSNWRLPTRTELISLIYCSDGKYKTLGADEYGYVCSGSPDYPAINKTFFPDYARWYWSSTPHAASSSLNAWYVGMVNSYVYNVNKSYNANVRLVR